ncbi:MAG: hypothetical protein KKH68_14680 [Proteobacteria bacterium]|nr:hypothetical protein [Pseudomonadota bacterium]
MRPASGFAKKLLPAVFFLVMALTVSTAAQENDQNLTKTVVATGRGTIYKNDSATAREKAIANGLASAIDTVLFGLLSPEAIVLEFKTINAISYVQAKNFIQVYKVLAESAFENQYKVMVKVTVSLTILKEQLSQAGIMVDKRTLPKILFLVSEKNLGSPFFQYWWQKDATPALNITESVLAQSFSTKGFLVISHEITNTDSTAETFFNQPDLDNQQALNFGVRLYADVVVVGNSIVDRVPNVIGDSIKSFKGTVTVRAVHTLTGTEIAATTQSAVTANSDEIAGGRDALAAAGELAAKELAKQVAILWQHENEQINMIEIVLDGTANLDNFVKFRAILKKLPGVRNLQINELKSNQAIIMVDFQGSAKELADALILKTFESAGINIYEVSENHLRIELIPG